MVETDPDKPARLQEAARQYETRPDIRSGLVRILYSAVPLTLIAVLANSAILSIVQWSVISHATILTWFGVTNGLSLLRLGFYLKFRQLDEKEEVPLIWSHLALGFSAASGLTWGAVAVWMFPESNFAHQVFIAFVTAGMCAGAVTTLSPILSSAYVFILFAMLPAIVRFFQGGTDISYAMATMAVIFAIMMLSTSRKQHQTIRESLLLRHEQVVAEETIQYQAYYDSLTDLPNRRLLIERLNQEIARSRRHGHVGAVMFLDLDHFKTINDSLGHAVGDKLLKEIATRISQRLRAEDTAARLGGDEFIILLSEVGDTPDDVVGKVMKLADTILQLLEHPIQIDGHDLHVTGSIGIALFPLSETNSDQLLQKSDVAMYEAKQAGRNTIRIFQPEMQKTVDERRAIEKGIRRALAENELELYYQPQVDTENNILGLEALLRWNHPAKGIIAPIEFMPIAESTALVFQIGDWVLNTACKHLAENISDTGITVSINISPRQFVEPEFVNKVQRAITENGIRPENIQLEITESVLIQDIETAIIKMQQLKALGVGFAIDDFGTGYSSLSYLKRLPVDILKIDRSFVMDIDEDENDAVIVETIIAMAKHMKIDIVAEGVENDMILEHLKSRGCHKFQGYLFARPMPIDKLVDSYPQLAQPGHKAKVVDFRS